jgi:uncharacterized membrane protein HdeD (DUF308 family)
MGGTMDFMLIKAADAVGVRGAIAIVLGIIALFLPGPTFLALAIAFGAFALIDGLMAFFALFDRRSRLNRGWLAIEAIAGIAVGVLTFRRPASTGLALTYLIAAWALVTGVMKIAEAIRLRKHIRNEWLLVLSGLVSILFGGLLAAMPIPGIIGLIWVVGLYGLVFGAMEVALSFRLRRAGDVRPPAEEAPRKAA